MAELTEAQEAALKAEHGKLVTIELDGQSFAFRRARRSEITVFFRRTHKSPESAIDNSISLCKTVLVWPAGPDGQALFDEAADVNPLAFAGTRDMDGVADLLIKLSRGENVAEAK